MGQISNFTFDEITIGQTASYSRHIGEREIMLFAEAADTQFGEPIAHGILSASLISAAVALRLPGPGAVYVSQSLRFLRPVKAGDELTATLTVTAKREDKKFVTLDCEIVNQQGKPVVSGEAVVLAPSDKTTIEIPELPAIAIGDTG